MKKVLCLVLTMLMVFSALPISAADNYEKALSRIAPFYLIHEKEADAPVTRGEAVKALVKLLIKTDLVNDGMNPPFVDVDPSSEYAPYINFAYTLGFLSGVDGTHFAPEKPITAQQFMKVAVSVLGYKIQAEKEGGYPSGYMSVAAKHRILDGVVFSGSSFTFENAVKAINNMMDVKTLEEVYGTDLFEVSKNTLYEQMLQRGELKALKGIITAVGKTALKGYLPLEKGEVSLDGYRMEFPGLDVSMLGKRVMVTVLDDGMTALPQVESIYEEISNEEIIIDAEDLITLDASGAKYYRGEMTDKTNIKFSDLSVIYNGRRFDDEANISIPAAGNVRALDNDGDKSYEVLFIDEYESFIIDRIATINNSVYFKDGETYRGKSGINFDFEDRDKEYKIVNAEGKEIEFSEINEGMVISVWGSKAEDVIKVAVNDKFIEGKITMQDEFNNIYINDVECKLYPPVADDFLKKYAMGQFGVFALNHAGEIVGISGELMKEGSYGYVLGFDGGSGISGQTQVKIVPAGTREKIVEMDGDEEKISYNYANGEIQIFEFTQKVIYVDEYGVEDRISADSIPAEKFNRAVAYYKLNSDGKIKHIELFKVPGYESAVSNYAYSFNAKITSFGASPYNGAPFYAGESTKLICVPINANPVDEDFGMDVTIDDEASYTILPFKIDPDTQIAECAILISEMDSTKVKNFRDSDVICVVGSIKRVKNDNGGYDFALEVLKHGTVETPYLLEGSLKEGVLNKVKKGDLIRYNTKSTGEIANIEILASLSTLSKYYDTRTAVYAQVNDVSLNRLDGSRNVKVDIIEANMASTGRTTKFYVERDDDPIIYTYEKGSGVVREGSTDEMLGRSQVGDGATDVFILLNESEPEVPKVIVNILD